MFTGSDERMTILKMIEENKITAEQGAQLLGVLGKPGEVIPPTPQPPAPPKDMPLPISKSPLSTNVRRFRVLVTDVATGKNKVSVTLPMGLVRWGLHTGARYSSELQDIDLNELADLLESGVDGPLIDVVDEEDGEHVQIFIE
jgi:hypothetical protein